jgi:hypothetical protein
MQAPEQVLGLIVQNANAHRTGLGSQWDPVMAYWSHPNPENEAAATAHLTFEGVRNGYLGGMPPDVAARIPAEIWEEDWRVMQLPGRMETQRALVADYGNYVDRFDAIAQYLARWQPPSLTPARHDFSNDRDRARCRNSCTSRTLILGRGEERALGYTPRALSDHKL